MFSVVIINGIAAIIHVSMTKLFRENRFGDRSVKTVHE